MPIGKVCIIIQPDQLYPRNICYNFAPSHGDQDSMTAVDARKNALIMELIQGMKDKWRNKV